MLENNAVLSLFSVTQQEENSLANSKTAPQYTIQIKFTVTEKTSPIHATMQTALQTLRFFCIFQIFPIKLTNFRDKSVFSASFFFFT